MQKKSNGQRFHSSLQSSSASSKLCFLPKEPDRRLTNSGDVISVVGRAMNDPLLGSVDAERDETGSKLAVSVATEDSTINT